MPETPIELQKNVGNRDRGDSAFPRGPDPTAQAGSRVDNAQALRLARTCQSKTLRGRVRLNLRRRRRRNRPGNAQALGTAQVMTLWKEASAVQGVRPPTGATA